MANKSSNYLHELIKSLTKAEKRYFKIYVSRHTAKISENNNKILFDAIDKQSVFDENILVKSLKNHLFIKKFSITKARLYETILKSLDAYYAEKSSTKIILSEIHYIEILYNKSLYKQCTKKIISAKKLAVKYNKKELLKEVINWQKKLIEKENYANITLKEIEKLVNLEKEISTSIDLDTKLWELKSVLFYHINTKGRARSLKEVEGLKELIYRKLTLITVDKNDIKLYYLYLHIKSAYYFAVYDYINCFAIVQETITHLESNNISFKEEPNILFSELNNCVYLAIQIGNYNLAKYYYNKVKVTYSKLKENATEDLILKLKSSLLSLELNLIKNTVDLAKGEFVLTETINFIAKYKEQINETRLAYLYYNIAVISFLNQDYTKSLKWINNLLNNINIDKSQEIYSFAKIFNLIIHLELDNKELILYTIKSTKRFLHIRNKMFDFEIIILNFIREISSEKNFFETEEAYTKLVIQLNAIKENKYEKIPLESFDYLSWAQSKTQKKPAYKVYKENSFSF
jgi:hypothetical protein